MGRIADVRRWVKSGRLMPRGPGVVRQKELQAQGHHFACLAYGKLSDELQANYPPPNGYAEWRERFSYLECFTLRNYSTDDRVTAQDSTEIAPLS